MNWEKFKIYLLHICTFGISFFYSKRKAKELINQENKELTLSDKIKIDVSELINLLGSKENIVDCTNTISAVKVFLKDTSIVKVDLIKKMGVKGIMKGKDYISFLFGDFSHLLKDEILKEISL